MSSIKTGHAVHDAACAIAESNRQAATAAAGSNAALVIAADVAFYRAVLASAKAQNLPYGNFTQALFWLGTGGQ